MVQTGWWGDQAASPPAPCSSRGSPRGPRGPGSSSWDAGLSCPASASGTCFDAPTPPSDRLRSVSFPGLYQPFPQPGLPCLPVCAAYLECALDFVLIRCGKVTDTDTAASKEECVICSPQDDGAHHTATRRSTWGRTGVRGRNKGTAWGPEDASYLT